MTTKSTSTTDDTSGALATLRNHLEGPNTIGDSNSFWVGFSVIVALLVVYPLIMGEYAVSNAALFLLYAVLGLSLTVVWGYTGVLSFGQVAFFGIAGYTFGIVSINLEGALGTMVAIPVSVAVATVAALVLGYFMFYGDVRDVYVTILTLVVTIVLHTFMAQTAGDEWTIGSVALGGFNGMPSIPNLHIGIGSVAFEFTDAGFYWLVLAILISTYLGLRWLVNGNFGYAMVAVREDEDRTEMLGYDIRKIKLLVFTFGGALAGLSGVLYATWGNYLDPSVFSLTFASLPVIWASVGGRHSLLGVMVATVAIEWFRQQLAVTGSEYAIVVVGAVLLVVILAMPEGVVPRLRDVFVRGLRRIPTDINDREGVSE